jgi:hypothetical protein
MLAPVHTPMAMKFIASSDQPRSHCVTASGAVKVPEQVGWCSEPESNSP